MLIKTSDLQKAVNLAINGCGQNSQIPVTQLFGLRTMSLEEGNNLVIGSTDTINYLYTNIHIDSNEQFDVCINANIFTQLINKFTTETVEIVYKEKYLQVVADGEYKLEISLLDNGEIQTFPKNGNLNIDKYPEPIKIETKKFRELLKYGEDALATSENEVDLNGYYTDSDVLIATNRKIMTAIRETLGVNVVLRRKLVELICKSNDEEVYLYELDEKNLLVLDTTMNIYSIVNSPVENYPSKQIKSLVNESKFEYSCKVNIKQLLNILDRISLMVTKYDSDIIELSIAENLLLISSVKSTGSETLALIADESQSEYIWTGKINCEWLKTQLATFDTEVINLFVGNKVCIKLAQDNIVKLICLA